MINDGEAPDEGEERLDDTEDTRRQETGARSGDSDRLEERRGVVVDRVDTERWREVSSCSQENRTGRGANSPSTVLPDEERSRDEHATEEEALAEDLSERSPETSSDGRAIVLDLDIDLVHLVDQVRLLGREVADEAQVLDGFVAAVPRDQPTRRLLDEERDTGEEHASGDELNGERDEPLLARRGNVLRDTFSLNRQSSKSQLLSESCAP